MKAARRERAAVLVACRLAGLSALGEAHYAGVNRTGAMRDQAATKLRPSPRTASDTQTLAGTHWSVANEIEQHDQETVERRSDAGRLLRRQHLDHSEGLLFRARSSATARRRGSSPSPQLIPVRSGSGISGVGEVDLVGEVEACSPWPATRASRLRSGSYTE